MKQLVDAQSAAAAAQKVLAVESAPAESDAPPIEQPPPVEAHHDADGSTISPESRVQSQPEAVAVAVEDGVRGVHVILLLHLPRGTSEHSSGSYFIDFDTRWQFSFVDAGM